MQVKVTLIFILIYYLTLLAPIFLEKFLRGLPGFLRGGPLEIPGGGGGGGDNSQKKISCKQYTIQKNSCKQGKVINQNENQSDFKKVKNDRS